MRASTVTRLDALAAQHAATLADVQTLLAAWPKGTMTRGSKTYASASRTRDPERHEQLDAYRARLRDLRDLIKATVALSDPRQVARWVPKWWLG